MDELRTEVTEDQISTDLAELSANIDRVPAHFIFNMDEVGHQDWADRTDTYCSVPADYPAPLIHFPIPRTGKRITVLVCIGADGSYLRPGVVIARQNFEDELVTYGLSAEKVEIYHQDRFKDTFILEVRLPRARTNYHGLTYLILDNCSAYAGEEFEVLCEGEVVCPVFIPPHSSHLVQPLDLSLFGLMKKSISKINTGAKCNVQTKHIVRIIAALQSAAVWTNVVATFRAAGISLIDVLDGQKILYPLCVVTTYTMRCYHEMFDRDLRELVQELENIDDEEEDTEFDLSSEPSGDSSWDGTPRAVKKAVREIQDLVCQGPIENWLRNGPKTDQHGQETNGRRQEAERQVCIEVIELSEQ
jgi:hypothetical protein